MLEGYKAGVLSEDIAADAAIVSVSRLKEPKAMVRYVETLQAQLDVRMAVTGIMPSNKERRMRP